jgi:hypothetical protein
MNEGQHVPWLADGFPNRFLKYRLKHWRVDLSNQLGDQRQDVQVSSEQGGDPLCFQVDALGGVLRLEELRQVKTVSV